MPASILLCIFPMHMLNCVAMATHLGYMSSKIIFLRKCMFLSVDNAQGQQHWKKMVLEHERPTQVQAISIMSRRNPLRIEVR